MPATFEGYARSNQGPAADAFAVSPHDTNDLGTPARALYIGGGGDVVILTQVGTEITFANIPTGTLLPINCTRVKSTGTNATNIVGLV